MIFKEREGRKLFFKKKPNWSVFLKIHEAVKFSGGWYECVRVVNDKDFTV